MQRLIGKKQFQEDSFINNQGNSLLNNKTKFNMFHKKFKLTPNEDNMNTKIIQTIQKTNNIIDLRFLNKEEYYGHKLFILEIENDEDEEENDEIMKDLFSLEETILDLSSIELHETIPITNFESKIQNVYNLIDNKYQAKDTKIITICHIESFIPSILQKNIIAINNNTLNINMYKGMNYLYLPAFPKPNILIITTSSTAEINIKGYYNNNIFNLNNIHNKQIEIEFNSIKTIDNKYELYLHSGEAFIQLIFTN
jgi:hypothetical protein